MHFRYVEVLVVDEDINMHGHVDAILDFSQFDPKIYNGTRPSFNMDLLPKEPIVVDMKTISDWQWKTQVMKYGIHRKYVVQITIYIHLLGLKSGLVIYENKNDSAVAAYKVDSDNELFEKIRWQARTMKELAAHQPKPLLPPPKPTEKSCYECEGCDFAPICHASPVWNDPKLEEKRKRFYGSLL
jgi:hypothetical protein